MNTSDLLAKLPTWLTNHKFYKIDLPKNSSSSKEKVEKEQKSFRTPVDITEANIITSTVFDGKPFRLHRPLIDIDMEVALIPSSTPGHHHLYIDHVITHDDYRRLLAVMVEIGIVQLGILNQFDTHNETALRLPHIKKETDHANS